MKAKYRLYINLWLVFLASGLWHGASWGFVIWGAYHGLFLVLERAFLLKFYDKIGKWPSILITFFLVVIGWIFFRVEKVEDALIYIRHLLPNDFASAKNFDFEFYFYFVIAAMFAFFTSVQIGQKIQDAVYIREYNNGKHILMSGISVMMFLLCVSFITAADFNPFIYFRF